MHIVELDRPHGVGSVDPGLGMHREMRSATQVPLSAHARCDGRIPSTGSWPAHGDFGELCDSCRQGEAQHHCTGVILLLERVHGRGGRCVRRTAERAVVEVPPGAHGDVVQRYLQDERRDSAEHIQRERLQHGRSEYDVCVHEGTYRYAFVNGITGPTVRRVSKAVHEQLLTGDTV